MSDPEMSELEGTGRESACSWEVIRSIHGYAMDLFDLPATSARVRVAAEAAGASPSDVRRALALAAASPPARDWVQFLTSALLLLGAGLLLSGIVCFFAFNWADLGRFAKFGVLEAAVAVCAALAWWKLRDLAGRVALFAAAVLVGPLLGVYGQTYQTGADPWGLFAFWALLILPWVVVAHFTALWMLTIALFDTALVLYWLQVLDPGATSWFMLFVWGAGIHVAAVTAWEVQRLRATPWLDEEWAPRLLVATAFLALLVPAVAVVFDIDIEFDGSRAFPGFVIFWIVVAAVFTYYSRVREDLFMRTAAGGAVMTVLTCAIGRVIFMEMKLEMFGGLLMAMILIAEVTLGVAWLRRMSSRASGGGPAASTAPAATPAAPAAPPAPAAPAGEGRE